MADRDAVWKPEKQRVQLGRHTYDRTGEDRQVDVSAGDRLCAVLPRSNRKVTREYDKETYKWRHLVENLFCKLKEFKKVAMRAEKTDTSFSANIVK
ncbi:hypothetical protein HMPREF9080_01117 [Cardiobacterium valvarum F0432]|uniref:Transposase DDE domain-containing protein n=1 Tax=Cardiobacterium valvarum F0432 TaxID=797473 RepID=G9ZED2_9GAMM|nr:hypothetical protein HMPREF9080_01117 [Cardiobacterium valvarum F0432]